MTIKDLLTEEERKVGDEIVETLHEYAASDKVYCIVGLIGVQRAKELLEQTIQIESSGGMLTAKGTRRRTAGGVFLTLAKSNISPLEREIIFPSGFVQPEEYLKSAIQKITERQARIGVRWLETKTTSMSLDESRRSRILHLQQLLLERISLLKSEASTENIADIKQSITTVQDEHARKELLARIEKLEKIAAEKWEVDEQLLQIEQERQRMEIALEAEERRTSTRLKYIERLLERESVASVIGSILLLVLVSSLIIGVFVGKVSVDIIEKGFLVILGYFFGQSVSKK